MEFYDTRLLPTKEFHGGVRSVEPAGPTDRTSANSLHQQTKNLRSLPQVLESLPVTASQASVSCGWQLFKASGKRQVPANPAVSVPRFLFLCPTSFFYSSHPFLFVTFLFLFINVISHWSIPEPLLDLRAAQFMVLCSI